MRDDLALALGFAVAGVGPLIVAIVLSPLREQPQSTSIVVVALVFVIAAAAVLAGPSAGAVATVTAALWFDFLFISPYLLLKVDSNDDWPVALLLAVGSGVVAVAGSRWPPSTGTTAPPTSPPANQSQHIARVVHLIEQGADPRDLISAVQAELTGLLLARSCRFEPGEAASALPRIERNGTVAGRDTAPPFPPEDLELPVRRGSHNVGRFVLTPTPGVSIPLEHRIVAVILTDHLAAAIASHTPSAPKLT